MRKMLTVLMGLLIFSINLKAQTLYHISENIAWSSIRPQPTYFDNIIVEQRAALLIDVTDAVCNSIQLGNNFLQRFDIGTIVFGSGSQLTVGGNFTVGTALTTINAAGSVDMTNGGTLKIGGSFSAPYLVSFLAGSGTIEYNGTAPQLILSSASLGNSVYNNLTINNPAGVTLEGAVVVANMLKLLNGKISIGPYNLRILQLGTVSEASGSSFVETNGTGVLELQVGTSMFLSEIIFDIGNGTYNPVTLYYSGAADNIKAKVQNNFDNPPNGTAFVNKQWTVTRDGNSPMEAVLKFQWNISDQNGSFQPNNPIYIGKYIGQQYIEVPAVLGGDGVPYHNATAPGFTTFSIFGVANEGVMPVELSSFTANIKDRDIKLNWVTASENNNSGFEIQKQYQVSGNKYSDWEKISFVNGNGTKSTPTNYSFEDKKLNTGKYNYRLKQIDYNGNFEYFELKSEVNIGVPNKYDLSQNYPNPFNPVTKIDFDLPSNSKVLLKVYDISGRELQTLINETKQAGYYTVEFNGNNLSSGIYFYIFTADNFTAIKKMMLIK